MPAENPAIFINYRRKICLQEARLLYLMLSFRFPGQVFQDERSLGGGDVWKKEIEQTVRNARVMLTLIPPKWISHPLDETKLDDPQNIKRTDL
ncbi:MAG TPA: hypothetical protein DCF33_05165, partial [Saprospirales bacterium]|nr:hypothetical protein [Saprospirales bacterium]